MHIDIPFILNFMVSFICFFTVITAQIMGLLSAFLYVIFAPIYLFYYQINKDKDFFSLRDKLIGQGLGILFVGKIFPILVSPIESLENTGSLSQLNLHKYTEVYLLVAVITAVLLIQLTYNYLFRVQPNKIELKVVENPSFKSLNIFKGFMSISSTVLSLLCLFLSLKVILLATTFR